MDNLQCLRVYLHEDRLAVPGSDGQNIARSVRARSCLTDVYLPSHTGKLKPCFRADQGLGRQRLLTAVHFGFE